MIKITEYGIQGSNVELTMVFTDLLNVERTKTASYPITQILGKTQQEITDFLLAKVENFRGQQSSSDVESLIGPLVNVDLEAT
jgi:hypothetical protein